MVVAQHRYRSKCPRQAADAWPSSSGRSVMGKLRRPVGSQQHPLRLGSGSALIGRWSAGATQAARNAVHEVLFAVAEGSADDRYMTVNDAENPHEFFVLLRNDIAVKIRV